MKPDLLRRYGNLLHPDGTSQLQRLLPGLAADYVVPDERSPSDLVDYLHRVAAEVRFVDASGQPNGDWRALLRPLLAPGTDRARPSGELQVLLASRTDWPPHLALLLVFLKLYQFLQVDLNALTHKHLLHDFERQLGLLRRAATPDRVHVLFTLAPNALPTLLPAGTLLDAGKDEAGRTLAYATTAALVVNRASIADLRRMVVQTDPRHGLRVFTSRGWGDGSVEGTGAGGATFGTDQLELEASQRTMAEFMPGFIVAAPVLGMAEGDRTVTLRAHLRPDTAGDSVATQGVTSALVIAFSGATGWLDADSAQASVLADGGLGMPALLITATLGAAAAAVVAADPALHGDGLVGARAAMRCLVKGDSGLHALFDRFSVARMELAVDVHGVRDLVVQNDDAVLESGKPLPLFGSRPVLGSAFLVGSAEVFGKHLTGLDIQFTWKSPPADLFDHYRGYFDNVDAGLSDAFHALFQVDLDLLNERVFRPLLFGWSLFQSNPAQPVTISADASAFTTALAGLDASEHPDLAQPESFDGSNRFGFIRMRLTRPGRVDTAAYAVEVPFEAFGHGNFAARYAVQAIALSQGATPAGRPLPKEPYTPVLSTLSLDYRATATLLPAAFDDDTNANARFFTVEPFGVRRACSAAEARLVTRLNVSASLLLGIANIAAPANLTLWFDIEAGTASGNSVLAAGDTEWSVLDAQDRWQPLPASALLADGTEGFQAPGVIALGLPIEASLAHDSLPAGLLWLRARIVKPPGSAARTRMLRTQAAVANFAPGTLPLSAYASHLEAALPPGRITRPVQRNVAIAKVEQPRPSFGGTGAEDDDAFVQRASERLRHRNRAAMPSDHERLVLDAFPEVFKLKCLPHTDDTGAARAGHTALVVVPDLRQGGGDPLEPRAGEVLLERIRALLGGLMPPFATLHVIRPAFERLRVEAQVVFARGRDPGWYAGVLNDDLCRFLSPWAYQDGEDILFGARIYRSDILAFIEGRDYVNHLVGMRLFHHHAGLTREGVGWMRIGIDSVVRARRQPALRGMAIGDDFIVGRPVEVAETTQPHAILVSHPRHLITPVAADAEVCAGVTLLGIGYMTVGLDFDVALETAD